MTQTDSVKPDPPTIPLDELQDAAQTLMRLLRISRRVASGAGQTSENGPSQGSARMDQRPTMSELPKDA